MSRELLEKAAKAAGVSAYEMELLWLAKQAEQGREISVEDVAACVEFYGHEIGWNPLADDGDAFRLAVKLRLDICLDPKCVQVFPFGRLPVDEEYGDDPYAATRLAIVRAAAAIGEAK